MTDINEIIARARSRLAQRQPEAAAAGLVADLARLGRATRGMALMARCAWQDGRVAEFVEELDL